MYVYALTTEGTPIPMMTFQVFDIVREFYFAYDVLQDDSCFASYINRVYISVFKVDDDTIENKPFSVFGLEYVDGEFVVEILVGDDMNGRHNLQGYINYEFERMMRLRSGFAECPRVRPDYS